MFNISSYYSRFVIVLSFLLSTYPCPLKIYHQLICNFVASLISYQSSLLNGYNSTLFQHLFHRLCRLCDSDEHFWRKCPEFEKQMNKSEEPPNKKNNKYRNNKQNGCDKKNDQSNQKSMYKGCTLMVNNQLFEPDDADWSDDEEIIVNHIDKAEPAVKLCALALSSVNEDCSLDKTATYLDSGAAANMRNSIRSCNRWFEDYGTNVQIADNTALETNGIGSFKFKSETGHIVEFTNTIVCPFSCKFR